jgi:hypothetical protein
LIKNNRYVSYIAKNKNKVLLAALIALGMLIMLLSLGGEEDSDATEALSDYKKRLEDEIETLCSSVEGAGRCRVTVTFEQGESFEYRGSSVVGSSPPKVLGVTVICEGGGSPEVCAGISRAMVALFDIGTNRVCVLKMKK